MARPSHPRRQRPHTHRHLTHTHTRGQSDTQVGPSTYTQEEPMTVIRVDGTPAPQGSKIRTRYGMFESSKRVKPWREAVINAVKGMEQIAPPYDVTVHMFIPRPKSTRAAYPVAPAIGDIDKMLRATYDGLVQGGI